MPITPAPEQATAIFWEIPDRREFVIVRTRQPGAAATFKVDLRRSNAEIELLTFVSGELKWSSDDANPRRQRNNTITKAQAVKQSGMLRTATELLIDDAAEQFKVDPFMREAFREVEDARFIAAVAELRNLLRDSGPHEWLSDTLNFQLHTHARAVARASELVPDAGNPWAYSSHHRSLDRYDPDQSAAASERVRNRRARIIYVITGN